ncbi:unnamed protein product, partial [Gadus morhua 'NCC']
MPTSRARLAAPWIPRFKLVVPLGPPAVSTDIQGPLYGPRYHDDAEQRSTARTEGPTTEGPTTEGPMTEGPTTQQNPLHVAQV